MENSIKNVPILPSSQTRYQTVEKPPGAKFQSRNNINQQLKYDSQGNLVLSPGDYTVPVMTYCTDVQGASPAGHNYRLAKLSGTMAELIRKINLKALPRFSVEDIQILSWSLQAGLSFQELTSVSQEIVDAVAHEEKSNIQGSYLDLLERRWNSLSENSRGLVPSFDEASDSAPIETGELSRRIEQIRKFKSLVKNFGNNYQLLSQQVPRPGKIKKSGQEPPWSLISDRIYARFITDGSYGSIGYVQIRILPATRKINSLSFEEVIVNLNSWLADPGIAGIQPLSFSALYGYGGVTIAPVLAEAPLAAVLILGAVLAANVVDWDTFFKLKDQLRNLQDRDFQNLLKQGDHAFQKIHDEFEKPLRDLKILDKNAKDTSSDKRHEAREYTLPGGQQTLDKDFEKIPGDILKAEDGTDYKKVSEESKVVKRPATKDSLPTLELQPLKGSKFLKKLRVKVRYE